MRTTPRAGLAASLVLASIAFAPLTNAQLFDADRQHLNKADADSSVVAAAFARDAGSAAAALPGTVSNQPCVNGVAGVFACDGIDMLSFIPLASFASSDGDVEASDIWGWTDPVTADEIVLLGTTAGTAVFRVTDPADPEYLGRIENPSDGRRIWQDIKVDGNFAYIASESYYHGMLVFDLTSLRQLEATSDTTLQLAATAQHDPYLDSHNLVINTDQQMAYLVGSQTQDTFELFGDVVGIDDPTGLSPETETRYRADDCAEGLHAIDISEPTNPVFAGCWAGDEYVHDAQCTRYTGGDVDHQGKDICLGANEDTVSIVDMSDPANPQLLSRTTYDGAGYVHQGWLTEDQSTFLLGDEGDEGDGEPTRTMIFDVTDLDDIQLINRFEHDTVVIDHNLYTLDGLVYMSNYEAGLRIQDLDDVANGVLTEVAWFDTYPESDNAAFNGTWSNFPFFKSGTVAVSGIGEGLFLLRVQDDVLATYAD